MWSGTPKLAFVALIVLNCLLWSQSRYAHVGGTRSALASGFAKRGFSDVDQLSPFRVTASEACQPLSVPPEEQCTHVKEVCDMDRTFLDIGYLESYFCADTAARPPLFVGYAVWLLFLFSTLGISASDFFCPNLGTIAHLLGLDENVAGVTFLAFGNGSPDMFATFSAMRSNSGGLAIGELLGAAAFITSCVVGSMCIIKPFKVSRGPFLRDVGFFTVAVSLLLIVLWDNKLEAWEAAAMIVLYAVYVTAVVIGSWWRRREEKRRRLEALMRAEYADEEHYHDEEPYIDEPSFSQSPSTQNLQVPSPYSRARSISHPDPPRLGVQTDLPQRPRTRSVSPSSPPLNHMPSFSLVGALEFRRVVSSLQRDAASASLSPFESPLTPYSYRRSRHSLRSGSRTPLRSPSGHGEQHNPWDAALGVPLDERPAPPAPQLTIGESSLEGGQHTRIPSISHTPASPTSVSDTDAESQTCVEVPRTRRQRVYKALAHVGHILFPTLHDFWSKSSLGKIAAILAAPAVMALTLTLPVVVTAHESPESSEKRRHSAAGSSVSPLIDFEEEGVERTLIAEDEVEEEMHELKFNKWLMAVQCCLGPLFCAAVLLDGMKHEGWLLLATGVTGLTAAILVAVFADKGLSPAAQLARCAMGFVVAVVWIMAIADEVVKVLQTFGFIFGLSDAIIGITIFAIGNSLADLVANMSVAVFAPIMGFSACFGGPMLNILLGVGISGSYIVRQTGVPYPLHFSPSLVITGTGLLAFLLATLVFVPMNGYLLPRTWGVSLICAYLVLMAANIVVEVMGSQ
ncbi:Sodium/calcium exchanger protein-domain-containing protein [Dichomitus squalens]|uniref:Sodium/calcium exchanger protein-domain-containing protein n=1 Tax=Dichomitus squalens TaxID=114155 RepID=A0A4Q9Q6E3_9APHY|nr:Sodium/calcium exchanger protein-domain-containing protein [Dichomitus squalens]TBU63047.1 Sodium/calcium exchanger protein-domain-containing protein [Dichomitus squalens]